MVIKEIYFPNPNHLTSEKIVTLTLAWSVATIFKLHSLQNDIDLFGQIYTYTLLKGEPRLRFARINNQ